MASELKISADTSEVKKSILDLSKSIKNIGSSKVAIFTADDKKFIKTELKKEMDLMKQRIKDNRTEIKKMVDEQKKMVSGSREELEIRKKILDAYKTQGKLSKEHGDVMNASKSGAGGGGILDMLTGKVGGLLGGAMGLLGGGALALGGLGIYKGIQGTNQYTAGASNRVRLKGLGVNEDNFGSPEELARAGVTEQDLIQRRIQATSVLGRQGSSNQDELNKARFERSFGLEGGTMTGIASNLRGTMGGQGANEAQIKLQATILASGIEDAIGPYLSTMSDLLANINENGMTNTADVTKLMAQLTKDSGRTPEQLSKAFQGINGSMMGATGEQSAFLQAAFAAKGIGGGSIGGTKFALSSGGLFGLNKDELAKRGYNADLLKNLEGEGQFAGMGQRTDAVMDMLKQSGGLGKGSKLSDVKNTQQFYGMNNLANSVFGTKGNQGYEAALLLEKVQNKQMTSKEFDEQVKKMQESKDPQNERLDKINTSLAGQTDLLTNIDTNIAESLGKEGVIARNALKASENEFSKGVGGVMQGINSTGVVQGAGAKAQGITHDLFGGGYGEKAYDAYDSAKSKIKGWIGMGGDDAKPGQGGPTSSDSVGVSAKDFENAMTNALKKTPIQTSVDANVTVKGGMSKINESTYK